jgi:hypothetical protein
MEIALINAQKELISTVKCAKIYVHKTTMNIPVFVIYSAQSKALIRQILLVSRHALQGIRQKERNAFEDEAKASNNIFFIFLLSFSLRLILA